MNEAATLALKPPTTIREALADKFSHPHYITLFEVRDSTGFDSTRSADAISIGMYRSRGREMTGFEIKVSRSDWLRELKQPEKAEEIGKFCEWFYLVTSDGSIARIDEIPTPWGWMVLKGEKLKVLKKPERMKALPPDRHMLCSLLYSVRAQSIADIEKQIQEAVKERVKSEHGGLKYDLEQAEEKSKRLEQIIREYETASGLNIRSGWMHPAKVGAAVHRLMNEANVMERYKEDLKHVAGRARDIAEAVERQLAELEKEAQPAQQQLSVTTEHGS